MHYGEQSLAVSVVSWAPEDQVRDVFHLAELATGAGARVLFPGRFLLTTYSVHHWETPSSAKEFESGALEVVAVVEVSFRDQHAEFPFFSRREAVSSRICSPLFHHGIAYG